MDGETLKGLVSPDLHEYLDRVLEMCNAPYAVANHIELVSVDSELVRMKKTVFPDDLNSNGVVHGAASYGLLDHTFAVACNIKEPTVGFTCNVIYHRPCVGDTIESEASVINESKSVITVGVRLISAGKLIATADCVGFKMRMK
jgi:acyl-CoA thioesterase